jgi:hypothetical protein
MNGKKRSGFARNGGIKAPSVKAMLIQRLGFVIMPLEATYQSDAGTFKTGEALLLMSFP